MTTIIVHDEVVETIVVSVEGEQGPPGPPGEHGFTTSVDVIDGGTAFTDYTNGFIFDGGES